MNNHFRHHQVKISSLRFLLIWLPIISYAQKTSWLITGTVYDETGKSLPHVSVYVNNSSIGSTSDSSGHFTVLVPARYEKAELVASHVGYRAQMKPVTAVTGKTSQVVFKLDVQNEFREVVVTGNYDRQWRRKWKLFENGLYGDSPFARQCKILNPEAISLAWDEHHGQVTANASEPILIENQALGYVIAFHMSQFRSNGKRTFLSGFKYFKPSFAEHPSTYEKQIRNRQTAFSDSFRNFLVALTQRSLDASGMEVFTMKTTREFFLTKIPLEREVTDGNFAPVTADSICTFDPRTKHYVLHARYPLLVFQRRHYNSGSVFSDYPFRYSQIVLPNGYCIFSENGWLVTPNGITIHDAWAREGFAEMLPADYTITGAQAIAAPVPAIAPLEIKPVLAEAKLPSIILQQTVLNKEGLVGLAEKRAGDLITPDYVLTIRESDLSGSVFDLLKRIPGLRVTFDTNSNTHKIFFTENNANINARRDFDNTVGLVLDQVFYSGADTVIPMLNALSVRDIRSVSAVRYGNAAGLGARGANGALVIVTNK